MAWVAFGKTETVSDPVTGKVIASIVIRGVPPNVLVRTRVYGAKLGIYISVAQAKAAAELIVGDQ